MEEQDKTTALAVSSIVNSLRLPVGEHPETLYQDGRTAADDDESDPGGAGSSTGVRSVARLAL